METIKKMWKWNIIEYGNDWKYFKTIKKLYKNNMEMEETI